jgi:hypothetical protein
VPGLASTSKIPDLVVFFLRPGLVLSLGYSFLDDFCVVLLSIVASALAGFLGDIVFQLGKTFHDSLTPGDRLKDIAEYLTK